VATGLPSQEQVIGLLGGEFARAGYEIEDVVIQAGARPPKITVIADGDEPLDLDTIATLSRSASKLLDTLDAAAGRYVLEVSSPGVDRPLKTEKHFRRARGRRAEVTLADGSRLVGRLGETTSGQLRVVLPARARGDCTVRDVPLESILEAVVQVEFTKPDPRELELAGQRVKEAGT
jgi:ribosome maturation factor RimP